MDIFVVHIAKFDTGLVPYGYMLHSSVYIEHEARHVEQLHVGTW